ncbi:hypothetical protein ON010_g14179 [Phytophthora cinnamomi]|nr:hypothetical protein ON010_g14179 [Phytophthora cinnamomi]
MAPPRFKKAVFVLTKIVKRQDSSNRLATADKFAPGSGATMRWTPTIFSLTVWTRQAPRRTHAPETSGWLQCCGCGITRS